MRSKLWFNVLLLISIVVLTMPALAVEPASPTPAEPLPVAKPIGEWKYSLPGEPTIKGAVGSRSSPAPTPAASPAGILLTEDFEDGIMPPPGGWSTIDTHPLRNWTIVDVATYPDFVHSGSYAAWVNYDTPTASDEWLLTPIIDLTAVPDASLSFWALSNTIWCPSGGSGANMLLHVTNPTGTPIATVWDMCSDESWPTFIYRLVTVNLAAYQGQQVKLAWQYVGIDGESFGLDDISLTGTGGTPVVTLEPEHQRSLGDPCDEVQYDVTLTNETSQSDSFDITYSGHSWVVTGPALVGPVASGGSEIFQVTMTIPCEATCPDCDEVLIEAAAQASPIATDTATIETCIGEEWQDETTATQGAHWMAYTCTDEEGAQGTCFYFGGLGPGNNLTAYSQKYDIASDTWTPIADLPTPVFSAVAGYIDGKVYVAGGFTSTTSPWPPTGALQIYDVTTNSWSAGPDMPVPRGGSAGEALGGKLYVADGQDQTYVYRYLHEYDPVAGAWTDKALVPDFFSFGAGTASSDHLYVGGDYFGAAGFFEYDPVANSWEERADIAGGAGKKSPMMAAVPDCGGVFLYGGDLGAWTDFQDTTWYWHPLVNLWINYGATLNQATTGAGGGYADGRLWNFAGSLGSGPITPPPHESLVYCCPATPPNGDVDGHITDANTGLPLENANIFLSGVTDPDFGDGTWTDAAGYYSFGPLLVADYELRAAAYGYDNGNAPVTVSDGVTTTQDIVLDAAMPDLSPTEVHVQVSPNSTETTILTLDNDGTGELDFRFSEVPYDAPFPVPDGAELTRSSQIPSSQMPDGIAPEVYAALEASLDGAARFIVYLAEQADLSAAFGIEDWSARGHYVLDTLQSVAERTQAGLRANLDHRGVAYESRSIVNALVVRGNVSLAEQIVARPEVAGIGPDSEIQAPAPATMAGTEAMPDAIEWNIEKVRADDVWADFGVTGSGIVVSNIDTGVQWDHPALVNQYRGGAGNHDHNWWDPYGDRPNEPEDPHGHGTHTMGTMLGDDGGANQIGMAPGASWFACNGFKNGGFGYEAELLECAEFILAPWDLSGANPDPDLRADVVNNSWGGGQAQWWYNQIVYAWRAAGMFPVFSSGNEGPNCTTAGDPGDMANILSVGATDVNDSNAPGTLADFSSRGPALITGLVKPNVSAPGADIRSSVPGSTYQGGWGGTSMAAPHVAGEVALIWSAQPDLRGDVQLTQWIIEQNTSQLVVDQGYFCGNDDATSVPNNQYGWGRIDAYDAVDMAANDNWDISWLEVTPASGVVSSAGSVDIELGFSSGPDSGCYTGTLKVEYNDPYVVEEFLPVKMCVDCVGLTDITVSVLAIPYYVGDEIEFDVDIEPDDFTPPYTYTVDFGDMTPPMTDSGSDDPFTIVYSYTAPGTYTAEIEVWNCDIAEVQSAAITFTIEPFYTIYLPIVKR
jgi:subtilisin family serine protease